jgi:ligand-binding sensor domain-containing protein/serine phosphatase RsbU (regulator of sigma subunit)
MKSLLKIFPPFLLFVLFFCAFQAIAQTYNFHVYSVKQGLPSTQILSIYQDRLGFMWFGTHGGGVCKFDGKRFITYTTNDSLASNYVYSITQDEDGHMLFGTDNGLSIFNGKTFKNLRVNNGLPSNWVWKVFKDSKNRIWIGTKKGPCYFEKDQIKLIPAIGNDSTLHKNTIFNIYEDSKNTIWFCTKKAGIISIQNNQIVKFSQENGLNMNAVFCAAEDINNNLLVGTFKGLDRISNNQVENIHDSVLGITIRITAIIKDNFNTLWISTPTGLFYSTNNLKTFKRILVSNGLPSENLTTLYKDIEGNIWIGTDGVGIVKFSSLKFINYNRRDSLPADYINCVKEINGHIIGGTNFGAFFFSPDKNQIKLFKKDFVHAVNQIIGSKVASVEADENHIYFGTQNGLSVYDGKRFYNYDTLCGLKQNNIRSIKLIGDEKLLISTDVGLCYYEKGKIIKDFDPQNNITNVPVWCYAIQDLQKIWLATDNGLKCLNLQTKQTTYFGSKQGLEDGYIRSVCIDFKNNVWVSTPNGLYFLNNGHFIKFSEKNGLRNTTNIYSLTATPNGYLYLGTGKGLDKLDLTVFYKTGKLSVISYTEQEGFIGDECNLNAASLNKKNQLWIGTVKGLTLFDPRWDKPNKIPPQTHITRLRLNFEPFNYELYSTEFDSILQLPLNLKLPYNKNHISFDYIGLSYTNPEVVVYQYKLEGIDEKWSPITTKTEAVYPSLPPGTYTFKVIARNNDGVWSSIPAQITFTITPPFWQTPWFITLIIVTGLFSVYKIVKYRTKKLEETKIFLEQQVSERTKELREEKEKVEQFNKEILIQKHIIEEKNKDITDSINYAKRIQLAVLPSNNLIERGFKDSFIYYRPKDIVSGDFYWFAEKEGKFFIAAADCTGHGVPGAFMSMIGTNLLNQSVIEKGIIEPAKILTDINNGLKKAFSISDLRFDTKDGMDIALCAYNPKTNILEYAGANRPLYFIRNNHLEEIKANKTPIGAQTPVDYEFANHSFEIQLGDAFYLTSDGYADQFGGPDGKKYMTKKLKELFLQIHTQPVSQQLSIVEETIQKWMEGYEQIDDQLVIGIKF